MKIIVVVTNWQEAMWGHDGMAVDKLDAALAELGAIPAGTNDGENGEVCYTVELLRDGITQDEVRSIFADYGFQVKGG